MSQLFLIASIFFGLILGLIDIPACIGVFIILSICFLYSRIGSKDYTIQRFEIFALVSFFYIISSYITSSCFSESEYFLASDPIRYIAMVHSSHDYGLITHALERCYIELSDNNGLYNSFLRLIGILCNKNGTEASSFLITLPQTLFGILTIQTVYRILNQFLQSNKVFKYTLVYAFCSLVFLYSGIIVRDIVIAFGYALCVEIIIRPFKISGIIKLAIIMILCMGIRLYSGYFVSFFILYYVFFNVKSGVAKLFLYPIVFVALATVATSAFYDNIKEQTFDEIDKYSQWQYDVASTTDGFSSKLRSLPPVLSNVALSLYSQINPLPPYSTLRDRNITAAQAYMGSLLTVSAIWWYFISFGLLYLLFLKGGFKRIGKKNIILLAIAWLLIFVSCTMHVDIRRLMPVYPIIYMIFLYCGNTLYREHTIKTMNTSLFMVYFSLNILYLIIK